MQYYVNPKNGDKLSRLAFGCMRLPGDEKAATGLVRSAIDRGINYLDTAYIYPGNEVLLGKILKDGYREKVKLATKLPFYLTKNQADMERLFTQELARLQTDHIDYYLMHMINSLKDWERMVSLGVIDWIQDKKQKGQIVNIGFSFHGTCAEFIKVVDAYDFDFCMIQYNYLDENHQAGKKGLQYAHAKGMPVMIMEPLRGGKLAKDLPSEAIAAFKEADASLTPAQYALKWLYNQKEVSVVLSGMTNEAMLLENIAAATGDPLTPLHLDAIKKAHKAISESMYVPCTACGYCMPCPKGVDIPMCFSFYNDTKGKGAFSAHINYAMRASGHEAGLCVACGACEKHCPQHIPIRERLKDVERKMEGVTFRPMRFVIGKFLKR